MLYDFRVFDLEKLCFVGWSRWKPRKHTLHEDRSQNSTAPLSIHFLHQTVHLQQNLQTTFTPNPGLSNTKEQRLVFVSTGGAMKASFSANVSRFVLGPEALPNQQDSINCIFAEKDAAYPRTVKNEFARRVTGQRKQHESVPPSICFAFRSTSIVPIWRCLGLSWGARGQ